MIYPLATLGTRCTTQAALAISLVLAASAHAEPPSVKVTISLADRARPVQPEPGPTSAPAVDAEQVLSIEGLAGPVRSEQEQILVQLIASTPDKEAEEKSDYYFRLGQLYAQQQRLWRSKSIELASRADSSKNAKTKADATAAAEKAKQSLEKAVKIYKTLTDNPAFSAYPRMDVALFYYGYTLRSGGFMLESRQVFDKLLKNYPQSKYVPEAQLVFADYFFDNGQPADAEARYRYVLKFPASAVYSYAMYKLAWVHLGLQRFQEALESFFQVAQATKNDPKLERLNRAALRDFVRAFAEIGKADKAYPAFQRVDAPHALEMLEHLADLYLEQGKGDRAIYSYQELLRITPGDPSACMWRYNAARAAAYNAASPQVAEVCVQDVATLQQWARAHGAIASCASCTRGTKSP